MSEGSRIPGFYKLSLAERRAVVSRRAHVELAELEHALEAGRARHRHRRQGGRERARHLWPALRRRAQRARERRRSPGADGGRGAERDRRGLQRRAHDPAERRLPRRSGRVADDRPSADHGRGAPADAVARLEAAAARLLALATKAVPNLVARGGGPRAIDVRDLGQRCIVLHVLVDCRDAMGANLVNTIAEALGPITAEIAGGKLGLRILSNLCDRRRVHATAACTRASSSARRARARPRERGASSERPASSTAWRWWTRSSPPRASPSSIRTAPPRTTRAS